MAKVKSTKIHDTLGDKILNIILGIVLVLLIIIVGYPLIYVISCSFSSSSALESGLVVLWPVDFSLEAYEFVMQYKQVWVGFRNSVFYCAIAVFTDTIMTIVIAYCFSRRYFKARKFYTWLFFLTTRVSAGLIPNFVLRCNLGLFDNIWAVLISGVVSVGNVLILRTAINSNIPEDLFDAARIDGASHIQAILNIVLPLTKATLSVLILYTLVGQWNEYFTSMLYLRNQNLYPLQLVLRPIMTAASTAGQMDTANMAMSYQQQAQNGLENVRYALIIITTVPVLIAYFSVQKAFKGGVMMGSLKG
ncbi:MAG: carbohydrate ABC transporter permease [Oscillospiraceae bacterium]|nr:carbohydrate ABC transporter permease [Oscillospiraceae bacterium]